ncbi:hypothetical protein B0H12DRAFT_1238139 [Mycena haematopus]|nr:hypothetical protein B0H12DRAFT_1238139 [Mycena haematopus]
MPHPYSSPRKENAKPQLVSYVPLPKRRPEPPSDSRRAPLTLPCANPPTPETLSDWWHSSARMIKIVNGPGDIWSGDHFPFASDHGVCALGASMEQARLGIGMLHDPVLSIQWPGYQVVHQRDGLRPLTIERCLLMVENCTLAQLAQQVAIHLFEFSEVQRANFNPRDPKAILLGPGGIAFDRLRLIRLWTSTKGLSWTAEVGIVDDYMQRE